jgi:hypothetical protein
VSAFGAEAVAGFGVATRIEALGFTLIIALSTGVSPFVGQNYGAQKIDRIQKGLQFASRFSLVWGAVLAAVFVLLGGRFAALFTKDPHVVSCARMYLWILGASLKGRAPDNLDSAQCNRPALRFTDPGRYPRVLSLDTICFNGGAFFRHIRGVFRVVSRQYCCRNNRLFMGKPGDKHRKTKNAGLGLMSGILFVFFHCL